MFQSLPRFAKSPASLSLINFLPPSLWLLLLQFQLFWCLYFQWCSISHISFLCFFSFFCSPLTKLFQSSYVLAHWFYLYIWFILLLMLSIAFEKFLFMEFFSSRISVWLLFMIFISLLNISFCSCIVDLFLLNRFSVFFLESSKHLFQILYQVDCRILCL